MPDPKLALTVAARGNNLVCFAPPSPSAMRPLLAGVFGGDSVGGLHLALAPTAAVDEWARVAAQVAGGTGVAGGHTPARLTRLLAQGELRLLVVAPEVAHELVRRATLKLDALTGILLLWPEAWGDEDPAATLLQDVDKSAQRILLSADPAGSAPLIERYCWRAPVVDLLGPEPTDSVPPVRSMPVAWSRRREALLDLLEQLDPESLAVWVADLADRDSIAQALGASGSRVVISDEAPGAAGLVVAYDPPSPAMLRQLATAGNVVLLAPPGTEGYLARLAPNRRPLHMQGALGAAQAELAAARRSIAGKVEEGSAAASYAGLAPLLERFEATRVAAALYEMWQQARAGRPEPSSPGLNAAAARLWVAIGKRDAVTPHDLVAALIKDGGVSREAIGKVEIRESFSLIELGSGADATQVAERLTGKTIRKRRLVARVDKGRPLKRER